MSTNPPLSNFLLLLWSLTQSSWLFRLFKNLVICILKMLFPLVKWAHPEEFSPWPFCHTVTASCAGMRACLPPSSNYLHRMVDLRQQIQPSLEGHWVGAWQSRLLVLQFTRWNDSATYPEQMSGRIISLMRWMFTLQNLSYRFMLESNSPTENLSSSPAWQMDILEISVH